MLDPLVESSTDRTTSQTKDDQFILSFAKRRFMPFELLVEQCCPELMIPYYKESYRKELSKVVFQLEITSQYHNWTIIKRIEDFVHLQKQLRQRHRSMVMGVPVRRQAENDNSQLLLDFYELFLQQLSKHNEIRFDRDFLAFIEQPMLYERRRLKVYKQEWLRKRSGGRFNYGNLCNEVGYCQGCTALFGNWKRRLFTVTSEGIFYTKGFEPEESAVLEMVPFSAQFAVEYGLRQTGYKFGVVLNSCQRKLQLIPSDFWSFVLFIHSVKKSLAENKYLEKNRFDSFARERQNCSGKFYVDGEEYFKDVYHEMEAAKREIFITGWMVTPFFVLVRPNSLDSEYRLDKVLQRCAERGVTVNIIVFQEPKVALNNDSEYTKRYFESLHKNIKVMRHPKYILVPFLWSHHEKLVVIDQKVGFLGGLDLCYGRMDNHHHQLTDTNEPFIWEGADYANLRISDIYTPRQYQTSMIDRAKVPRMPWHDIAVQIRGESVIDLVRHFVQYWNFVNFQNKLNDRELLIQAGIAPSEEMVQEARHNKEAVERLKRQVEQQQVMEKRHTVKFELQRDLREKEEHPRRRPPPQTLKNKHSRSDSLSLATELTSKPFPSEVVAPTFSPKVARSQSFSAVDNEQPEQSIAEEKQFYRQHLAIHQPQEPTLSEEINSKIHEKWVKLKELGEKAKGLFVGRHGQPPVPEEIIVAGSVQNAFRKGQQRHQILRSASLWGLGVQPSERSIYNAYIQLITNAKRNIYIENQFFISEENEVANAIVHRINQAHHDKQPFKVLVVLPLLPGFEGEVDNERSAVLRLQLHLQYKTLSRGEKSLLSNLSHIDNLGQYIQFYGLRTHALLGGKPVTEIIYVHSKLLIVDDRVVLIGSANINDRSMLGSRDSEIAVMVEDEEMLNIGTAQHPIEVAAFAHRLRSQLYQQHFALTEKESRDATNEEIWWLINERCRKNALMYREVFACYPDSSVRNLAEFKQFQRQHKHQSYELIRELIVGHGVEFPMNFLEQESLALRASQMEFYVPSISFT